MEKYETMQILIDSCIWTLGNLKVSHGRFCPVTLREGQTHATSKFGKAVSIEIAFEDRIGSNTAAENKSQKTVRGGGELIGRKVSSVFTVSIRAVWVDIPLTWDACPTQGWARPLNIVSNREEETCF